MASRPDDYALRKLLEIQITMIDTDIEARCQGSVHDLPQLYTRPSSASLLLTLEQLKVKPTAWDVVEEASQYDEASLPRYLTSIVASSLAWIEEDSVREQIWEAASSRLSERSGRSGTTCGSLMLSQHAETDRLPTAIPSMSRTFIIPTSMADSDVSITLREPSLTADNLGHKTWLASYLLAKRLPSLVSYLPDLLESSGQVIELGAGTGLVGLAVAAMFDLHVHLTDLPAIVPNLLANVTANAENITKRSTTRVGEFDWSNVRQGHIENARDCGLVLAADPLYSPQHPAWLVAAIDHVLKRDVAARVVIELPLREAYAPEINELKSRIEGLGLAILVEGTEWGSEDWEDAHCGNERTEVECWWAVWRWAPSSRFLTQDDAINTSQSGYAKASSLQS
ncbi:MAG: hypothetical protein Q9178_007139 [Gyalolechia marmorata]